MHMQTVAQIVAKKFLTELDLLRLRVALLMCRMSANVTYLVNKEKPNGSTRLERLAELVSEAEELKRRLEVLLGPRSEANLDRTGRQKHDAALREKQRRERVSAAGGEMLGAVFLFLAELVQNGAGQLDPSEETVSAVRSRHEGCVEEDPWGRPRLSFTLPDRAAVDKLARTLSQLLVGSESNGTAS